ncbi:E3 ubiquitin-protein ligase RNF14 isoform X3 [Lepisosteus oculatus]|uniref:E3 ubiquitin-protein ligase RNF14 isoform X3 n=1 Tax=Lepisosteus oculatus TaxID=7918 RepID=UPI0035F5124D
MSSEDLEAQEDELLALASIYNEEEFHRAESAQGGEIRINLELPQDFRIFAKVLHLSTSLASFSFIEGQFRRSAFGAAQDFVDYPSNSPPVFTLSSRWLSRVQLGTLCKRLDELWQENVGSVVLFSWIQFLKEDLFSFLSIESPLEVTNSNKGKQERKKEGAGKDNAEDTEKDSKEQPDPRAIQEVDPRSNLLLQLLDFDEMQQQKAFDSKMFCCNICFSEKMGSECTCFKDCKHVYCKECMRDYFQIQIRDGNVQCLNCPEPECSSVATPAQVKHLVGEELFARYDRLLLQSSLDLMADVMYCPRKMCETAVLVEPDTTMGICPSCQYAFCTLCKMGYHGLSPCRATAAELRGLRDEYLKASEEEKQFLEQRFGKRVIQKAVEESFSSEWLEKNSKACPRCSSNIQKVDGCNKMTCTSCKQYFCWLCLGPLSRVNPYGHFNDTSSPCFNQLFQGVDIDDDEEFWSDEED